MDEEQRTKLINLTRELMSRCDTIHTFSYLKIDDKKDEQLFFSSQADAIYLKSIKLKAHIVNSYRPKLTPQEEREQEEMMKHLLDAFS